MTQSIPGVLTAASDAKRPVTEAHTLRFIGKGGTIPDGKGKFEDDIVVTENVCVSDVVVTLTEFVHTWVGDLTVRLHHIETGTVVDLLRRPGHPEFSSSGYSSDFNGEYTFGDDTAKDLEQTAEANTVIPCGNYASRGYLEAFKGISAAGTWRLSIEDCSPGDSGSLGSWSLELR